MSGYKPTEFARGLRVHMEDWSAGACPHPPMWAHWTEGIYPDYRDLARDVHLADEVKLHKYAAHLLSSQAFALNLFLPFREGGRSSLSECVSRLLDTKLLVETVRFEWVPPGALLGELEGDRPKDHESATGVDVVLWSRLEDGRRAVVLVETKLSEGTFTTCKGRVSPNNRRRDVCDSARRFFGDPDACYLRRPKGKERDRRYWQIFAGRHGSVRDAFPGADVGGPCPFAGNAQQPMRNLAIAKGLEQDGTVDMGWFALCAHDKNPDVLGHWNAWKGILSDSEIAPFLPASEVIEAGEAEGHEMWATWMRERYRLGNTR